MAEDSRVYPRTPTCLEVTYFTENSTVDLERHHYFAKILDVSRGGVGLISEQRHEPQEELWLQGLDKGLGDVRVKVCWVKHYYDKYSLGVRFASHKNGGASVGHGRIPGKWSLGPGVID